MYNPVYSISWMDDEDGKFSEENWVIYSRNNHI